MAWISLGLRLFLLLLFVVALQAKVRSRLAWSSFVKSMESTNLVRPKRARWLAVFAVSFDAASLAALTLLPPRVGSVIVVAVLGILTVGLALARRRSSSAVCACFSNVAKPLTAWHIVRNSSLLVLAGIAALLPAPLVPNGPPAAYVTTSIVVALAVILTARVDDVYWLLRRVPGGTT